MFRDRIDAGRALGIALMRFKSSSPVVLGLPRGGIPVAAEVAHALAAPLDIVVVRKLGLPGHDEYAMGALGEGDVRIVDWGVVAAAGLSAQQVARVIERERSELCRRAAKFRPLRPRVDLNGRTVIVVDDGIATGSTVTAAISVVRDLGARQVVAATPVAPEDTVRRLNRVADQVVVLEMPSPFYAVGEGYLDFPQTTDEEVAAILIRERQTEDEALRPSA
ncbi:MAG TPA: phosphoribosyltransferase family protein [Acidimicrobiia bacterium]|nr:phosphoribosyltransferase family protein [Acidimicrobiia bacterium]